MKYNVSWPSPEHEELDPDCLGGSNEVFALINFAYSVSLETGLVI